jgi:hypothetical protein
MNKIDVQKLRHGVYRLFWKGGGSSLASVGSLYDGTRWFAPTNWTSQMKEGICSTNWRVVASASLIATNGD